ncbi:protein chromosome transmission fidelity 7 [Quercus suber]|uniref:Protein chromosome transmission fidelity 7 n=1 Tax=Quercus suber TaxID=58331 RepID=A0AAW0M0G9_QUESU
MQAKISTFFKNPSSISMAPKSPDPHPIFDELTIWENKQHQFFNTYSRRAQNPDSNKGSIGEILVKKSNSDSLCSKVELKNSGKAIKTKKKRTYAQLHLDLGGRIVLVLDCDPIAHRSKVEEVVKMMEIELGSGWIFHKSCKVYLFISSQRIVGCLLAEPIKQAFKVCSCSSNGGSEGTSAKEVARQSSTSLQFGDISFKREVKKRTRSVNSSEVLDGNLNGAIICENEGVPAVCGIRAIWVTPSNRRKHIASQLLDAVRMSFCMGSVLELSQLALSQPTSAGKALASNYFSTGSFLVYKTNSLNSQMQPVRW